MGLNRPSPGKNNSMSSRKTWHKFASERELSWMSAGILNSEISGHFVVLVVRDGEWDAPIFNEAATDIASLCSVVKQAVRAATDVDAV